MIKDYVDRTSGMGSYDLAIPYPYKLFGDQEFSKKSIVACPNILSRIKEEKDSKRRVSLK